MVYRGLRIRSYRCLCYTSVDKRSISLTKRRTLCGRQCSCGARRKVRHETAARAYFLAMGSRNISRRSTRPPWIKRASPLWCVLFKTLSCYACQCFVNSFTFAISIYNGQPKNSVRSMADINGAFFIFADNEVCGHAHVYVNMSIQNTEYRECTQ